MNDHLYTEIEARLQKLEGKAPRSEDRKEILHQFIAFIRNKADGGLPIYLNFICTHNSRRSHLAQVWAQAVSFYCGVPGIYCYSGGTEATELFPATVVALKASGFRIQPLSEGANPVYSIKFSPNAHPVIGFSKTHDHSFNPKAGFAAVVTCSQADEACPFIPGAKIRIPLTFEDPKAYDGTDLQEVKYLERSYQIASEMLYVFKQVQRSS